MNIMISDNLQKMTPNPPYQALNQPVRGGRDVVGTGRPAYQVKLSSEGMTALASMSKMPVSAGVQSSSVQSDRKGSESDLKQNRMTEDSVRSSIAIINPRSEENSAVVSRNNRATEESDTTAVQKEPILLQRESMQRQQIEKEDEVGKQTDSARELASRSMLSPSRNVIGDGEGTGSQTDQATSENPFSEFTGTQLRMSVRSGQISLADMEKEMNNRVTDQQQKQQQTFLSQEAIQAYQVQAIAFGKSA